VGDGSGDATATASLLKDGSTTQQQQQSSQAAAAAGEEGAVRILTAATTGPAGGLGRPRGPLSLSWALLLWLVLVVVFLVVLQQLFVRKRTRRRSPV
jgi:hypothetical protein